MPTETRVSNRALATARTIEHCILTVRGERVVLDLTIAALYGVSVKHLKQAVKRNRSRFPSDFLLELTWEESRSLRSQIVTLDQGLGSAGSTPSRSTARGVHSKYRSLAFTEQGVAMLSSVLRSDRAVRVNVEIMRAFVSLRRILGCHPDLARRIDALERRYDSKFKAVFDALRALMQPPPESERRLIGFRTDGARVQDRSRARWP